MQLNNPIMQYQEQAINTMSRGELVIKLYDEALKQANYGSMMLKQKNFAASEKCLDKCKEIINYLSSILDRKYDISQNLYQIYYFMNDQIIKSSIKRDPSFVDEVIPLISEMRDTWVEAEKLTHMQN